MQLSGLILLFTLLGLLLAQPKPGVKPSSTPSVVVKKNYKEIFLIKKDETKYPPQEKITKADLKSVSQSIVDVRLVSNKPGHFHEGRVEAFDVAEADWRPVCGDYWNQANGDVACRQLGYPMGAEAVYRTHTYGEGEKKEQKDYIYSTLDCSGSELSIQNCTSNKDIECSGKSAGLKCYSQGGCPPGWTEFLGDCYQVMHAETDYPTAAENCLKLNATLAKPVASTQMGFLARLLDEKIDNPSAWIGVHLIEWPSIKVSLGWHNTGISLAEIPAEKSFWMPPEKFNENDTEKPCVAVRNFYKKSGILRNYHRTHEYWWANYGCGNKMKSVCQMERNGRSKTPINKVNPEYNYECYENNGEDYKGTYSKTEDGFICKTWPKDELTKNAPLERQHNYCRNFNGQAKPWCYVNVQTKLKRSCSLPKCQKTYSIKSTTPVDNYKIGLNKGNCPKDTFFCAKSGNVTMDQCLSKSMVCDGYPDCGLGEDEHMLFCTDSTECDSKDFICSKDKLCVDKTKVCDGFQDCSDGSDERDCVLTKGLVDQTTKAFSMRAIVAPLATIQNLTLEECVEKCFNVYTSFTYKFACEAVNYVKAKKLELSQCQLLGKAPEKSEIFTDKDSDLLTVVKNYALGRFNCKNGARIPNNLLCDGVNNCGDGTDEEACKAQKSDYKIRLVTKENNPNLGRIEVRNLQDWGFICIDGFDMATADIACKELGFEYALSFMTVNEAGIPYGTEKAMLEKMKCKGSEKSLKDCPLSKFFEAKCTKREAVAVECSKKRECSSDEFTCKKSGRCIPKAKVCNMVDDCGDNSDENHDCSLKVALEGPDKKSGRLLLIRGPINGTVCSDSFDDNAAQVACNMLGISGTAKVIPNKDYGPGRGLIAMDKLKCEGTEATLLACGHTDWGQHTCSHRDDVAINCHAKKDKKAKEEPAKPVKPVECGMRDTDQWVGNKMVEGGFLADEGAFPWNARIVTQAGEQMCNGAILSEKWIITAASCFDGISDPKGNLGVIVGDVNSTKESKDRQYFELAEVHIHRKYNEKKRYDNDFAMVKLNPIIGTYIKFNKNVKPICLAPENEFPSDKCLVPGWSDSNSQKLAVTNYLPSTQCKDYYGFIQDSLMCSETQAGLVDACKGDTGSPMVCLNQKKFKLYGLVSHRAGCGKPGFPSVNARPNVAVSWINGLMKE